jgi:protein-disulfide isomerase
MGHKFSFQQRLVLATAAVFLFLLAGVGLYHALRTPGMVTIDTRGHPSEGSGAARVQVVVFEDFRCYPCREYALGVFPKVKRQYVDTGKVRYTFIPLGFMEGSKLLGNAAVGVYKIAPDRFFAYAQALFKQFGDREIDGSERAALIQLAEEVGGIDGKRFSEVVEKNLYFGELDRNLKMARQVMGSDFGTPALYVDGVATPTSSFRAVQGRIEQALKGVAQ